MIDKLRVIELIASLEVPQLPSDHPDMKFWQGFHEAQAKITDLIEAEA